MLRDWRMQHEYIIQLIQRIKACSAESNQEKSAMTRGDFEAAFQL